MPIMYGVSEKISQSFVDRLIGEGRRARKQYRLSALVFHFRFTNITGYYVKVYAIIPNS